MADTPPKFEDTLPHDDAPPKFEDTVDVPKFDDTLPAGAADPEKENGERVWGLDTGVRVHHDAIQKLADKYGVPAETLERHAVRLGATYPDSSKGERALASGYHAADTMLANLPSWVQKKVTSLGEGGNTEDALDALKEEIAQGKTGGQKAADFVQGLGSPMRLPAAAAQKLAETGKYANAAATGAAFGGTAGLANSKSGDELRDATNSAGLGSVLAPATQFGFEKLLGSAGKMLGKRSETVPEYLNNPETRARVNDGDFNFENVQEDHFDAPRREHLKSQAEAEATLKGAKDDSTSAKEMADQARTRYRASLNNTDIPESVPTRVNEGLDKQRKVVADLANEQMDMLQPVEGKFSLNKLERGIQSGLSREQINGETVPGDKEAQSLQALQKVMDTLRPKDRPANLSHTGLGVEPLPDSDVALSAPDLVKLRQKIDAPIRDIYEQNGGSYRSRSDRVAHGARSEINNILDTQLPNSKEYEGVRAGLAHETDLASRASDTFGGDRKSQISALRGMADPANAESLQTLEQLDRAHGLGVKKDMLPYQDAQRLTSNPDLLARSEAWLPEVEAAQHADEAVGQAKGATQALKERFAPFEDITPDSSQEAMRKLLFASSKRPQVRTKEAVRALADETGQDTMGAMNSLRVKEDLGGGGPQGSRLVNMGRSVGKAIAGTPGEAIGGLAAGTLDYSTGKTLKLAMDGYLAAKDPTVRAAGVAASKIVDKLLSRGDDPKAQKYTAALTKAAERGPNAILAADMVLRKNPDYRALTDEGAK